MAVAAASLLSDDGDADVATPVASAPPTTATTRPRWPRPASPPSPGLPCRSALTADAPLRLWIAGDSIACSVGTGLGKKAATPGWSRPVYESRVSSGLSTPGFFDWPNRVRGAPRV